MVAGYLPPASQTALAWACYDTNGFLVHKTSTPSRDFRLDRVSFLNHFERFHPDHVLCEECARFHPRLPMTTRAYAIPFATPLDCPHALSRFEVVEFNVSRLGWWHVHQVMRSHRLGVQFGLGLNTISNSILFSCRDIDARIWQGELILQTKNLEVLEQQRVVWGEHELQQARRGLCIHSDYNWMPPSRKLCPDTIPHLAEHDKVQTYEMLNWMCHVCPSEFVTSFTAYPAVGRTKAYWTFGTTRYTRFGPCLHPREAGWKQLCHFETKYRKRENRASDFRPIARGARHLFEIACRSTLRPAISNWPKFVL